MTFQNFGLSSELLKAISDLDHTTPTPIQSKAIPIILNGSDVIGLAQTGTGKTGGFTLPLLQLLNSNHDSNNIKRQPRGLILAPTRELCAQIGESVKNYGRYLPLRSEIIFGGVNITPQIRKLHRGTDIIIATPGRLLDLVDQKVISLSKIEILVLDEADRMLDMGFSKDVNRILSLLPKKRQNMLFSATLSSEIQTLANKILNNYKLIEVATRNKATESVTQHVYQVDQRRKRELLSYLIGFKNWQQVLVFTRTKHGANRLCQQLIDDGLTAAAIHGNKSQGARTRALTEFKAGKIRILVATDIAARGIDIEDLPYVINFELPAVAEDYVHRIGRTGRAGKSGSAISLVCAEESHLLSDIEKLTKKTIAKEILPGYEPSKNPSVTTTNRSSKPQNGNRRQSTSNSFENSRRAGARHSLENKDRNRRATSKPSVQNSWQSEPRSSNRSTKNNRNGNWQSRARSSSRTHEDSRS